MNKIADASTKLDRRIREALSSAKMALWEFDITKGEVNWTGKVTDHFYDFAQSLDGTLTNYIQLVHQEDLEGVMEVLSNASDNGGSFFNQHRVKWPDGSYHWVEGIGNVVRSNGSLRMTGTVQDISEKKTIEKDREDWKQKHELVAKSAGIVVYDFTIETGQIEWSGGTNDLFGYSAQELGDIDSWESKIHPEDKAHALSHLEKAQNEIGNYDVVYRFKDARGGYKFVHDKGFFIGENKAVKMLGMMNDVTEMKRAQSALTESESRFKSMIHNMSIGIGLYDISTNPISCNKIAYRLLGMTEEQFMGQAALDPSWRVIHEDGSEFAPEEFPIPKAIKTKSSVRQEVMGVFRPKRKDWVWLLVDAEPVYDSSNKFIHVICTFSNITDLRNAKEKLNEKNQTLSSLAGDLQTKNERLLEFAQIVSHNLRSPVSSIVSLVQIYQGGDAKTREEIIQHIQQVSERALLTTDELNQILKIQQGDGVSSAVINLEKLLAHTIQLQKGAILDCSATVEGDFQVQELEFPPIYMESIFLNFLSNSLKYRSSERDCIVTVRTYLDQEGNLILEWEDNGLGIDIATHYNELFKLGKRFHANEDSRGVGLFLIKNQVDVMGGTITVDSNPGEWTRFRINFGLKDSNEIQ